jgi:hypothetical protein
MLVGSSAWFGLFVRFNWKTAIMALNMSPDNMPMLSGTPLRRDKTIETFERLIRQKTQANKGKRLQLDRRALASPSHLHT